MHLDRLIAVLESVAIAGRPISAAELHQMSGLPRPTCYRLLQMLSEQGLLDGSDEDNRYIIGDRLVRIASKQLQSNSGKRFFSHACGSEGSRSFTLKPLRILPLPTCILAWATDLFTHVPVPRPLSLLPKKLIAQCISSEP